MDAKEMRELGVLPIMYYGMYEVEKLPCGFDDERRDACGKKGYSTIYLHDKGYRIIACQKHWDEFWRNQK